MLTLQDSVVGREQWFVEDSVWLQSWEAIGQGLQSKVFMCYNFTKTEELGAMGFYKLEENLYAELSKWVPPVNKRFDVLSSCNGEWLSIRGLAFHMWRMDIFLENWGILWWLR